MIKNILLWLFVAFIKVIKAMSGTALGLISGATIGFFEVDWYGVFYACVMTAIITILTNIKEINYEYKFKSKT